MRVEVFICNSCVSICVTGTGVMRRERLWYEDGDSEDLDEKECLECIEFDSKIESG